MKLNTFVSSASGRRQIAQLDGSDLPLAAKIIKSLIAPARHSDGPTLYLICQVDEQNQCAIYEQLPDGKCLAWPEPRVGGV